MESVDTIKNRERLEVSLDERIAKLFEFASEHANRVDFENNTSGEEVLNNKDNRSKNYELLKEVLKERTEPETEELIRRFDERINEYENNSLVTEREKQEVFNEFLEDINSLLEGNFEDETGDSLLEKTREIVIVSESQPKSKEEIDRLLDYIDERIESIEKEFEDSEVEEYNFFADEEKESNNKVNVEDPTEQDINYLFDPYKEKDTADEVFTLTTEISERMSDKNNKLTKEEIDDFIKKIDDKLLELEEEEKSLESKTISNIDNELAGLNIMDKVEDSFKEKPSNTNISTSDIDALIKDIDRKIAELEAQEAK